MYIKEVLFSLVALTSLSEALFGGYATNITDCPWLLPRFPPTSVHDLRPDDIKVIGALGDRYNILSIRVRTSEELTLLTQNP